LRVGYRLLVLTAVALVLILAALMAQVRSSDQPPVASFTYSPDIPAPGQTITFNASSSYDSDGSVVNYSWDFGEGNTTTVTNPIITYQYPIDGNYTVQLTVTDNSGLVGFASAVIQVRTVVFFRVCIGGTLVPLSKVIVTAYYYDGSAWVKAPVGPSNFEIKYDNMTQPDLAKTATQRYRNPGFTASILRDDASNIGFDVHPSCWTVYFKFQWGSQVAYWPNSTTRVYSYKKGLAETHDYLPGHQAHWDNTASAYVINAGDIPGAGVSPCEEHPIIVCILGPPPPTQFYLNVKTDPATITTILGQGFYAKNTNVTLTALAYVNVSTTTRYRFTYWDVDGTSKGSGVNPIITCMNANHTATAHYAKQYSVTFCQSGLSSDATGTVVVVDSSGKTYGDLPYSKWVDSNSAVTYSYSATVSSSVSGKQYRLTSVIGPSSPITVTGPVCIKGCYTKQHSVTFTQTGLDSTATGTVVIVNGSAKTYSQLPYVLWVDCVPTVSYSYSSTVSSTTSGKRFRLASVTGPASPITVTGSTTVTGNYVIQYSVTFGQTGLDSTATGTVVTVNGNAKAYGDLSYMLWVDSGSSVTYSYNDPVLSTTSGERFKLMGVSGTSSPIAVTNPVTITGTYKIQFQVTFGQTGVGSDFTGTVVTIDTVGYNSGGSPVSFWWNSSSSHSFSYGSPLVVNANKQYIWSSTAGLTTLQGTTLTITASGKVYGNYVVGNSVTFDQTGISSVFTGTVIIIDSTSYSVTGLPVSFTWQSGSTHSFSFQSPLLAAGNSKQYVWTGTSGLSSSQSGSITVSDAGSVVGHYKTQYYLTLATNPSGITSPSGAGWYDANSYASISTASSVDIVSGSSRYEFVNWTTTYMTEIVSPSSASTSVLMDVAKTVTANYVTQYQVTFAQSGVGSDFTGTVATVDSTGYTVATLPTDFWWDSGSSHTFAFASPFIVSLGKEYDWSSTTGLSTLQSQTLTISSPGSVTANYVVYTKYQITFNQTGVGTDFTGTIISVDGTHYNVTSLPITFWWDSGSPHTFLFISPLDVNACKQYVWTTTSGLSMWRGGTVTASSSGSVTGNYKTQYYLTLTTSPSGVDPMGAGWYDAGTSATVSTDAFVNITPGSSRYRFNGWTTPDMSEITDPSRSPTMVRIDKGKTVTANYVVQYKVSFNQSGVSPDFAGNIATVDGVSYGVGAFPKSFWWDNGIAHTFAFNSPLVVAANSKQYVWTGTTGLSTSQTGPITVSVSGNVTGGYKTQYYLTVSVDPSGIATIPGQGWYDASTAPTLTAPSVSGYQFAYWDVDGTSQGAGADPITVTIDAAHTATAHYAQTGAQLTVTITPLSATVLPGNQVDFSSTVTGGTSPYGYQWYLNDNPVSGATSSTWTFIPTTQGVYYVYLKVTDALNNIGQSATARVVVPPVPVGGYSVSLTQATWPLLVCYATLLAMFIVAISLIRRKRK
jgi:hypothetical protein